MAKRTLSENIAKAIENFDLIEQSINERGISTSGLTTDEYADKILEIQTDMSSATATVDDILYPKVAFTQDGKVTGNIIPEYEANSILTFNKNITQTIQWSSYAYSIGLALYFSNSGLRIGKIDTKNNTVTEIKLFSKTDLDISGIATGNAIFYQSYTDKKIKILIVSSNVNYDSLDYYAGIYELDFSNLEDLKISLVGNKTRILNVGGAHNMTKENSEKLIWISPTQCFMAVAICYGGGYTITPMYLRHLKIDVNADYISVANNISTTLATDLYANAWGGEMSNVRRIYLDGNFIVATITKSYRGGNYPNNWYYITCFIDYKNNVDYIKRETSDIGYILHDNIVYGRNNKYLITDLNTSIGTSPISISATGLGCTLGNNIIGISSGNIANFYSVIDNKIILYNSFSGYNEAKLDVFKENFFIESSTSLGLFTFEREISLLNRKNVKYLNTKNGTITSNDVLEGKIAFSKSEQLKGTMPNNGALNYEPSNIEQTIPEGYTTGGIINPVSLKDITIIENGEYEVPEDYNGYGKLTVNVSGEGGTTTILNVTNKDFISIDGEYLIIDNDFNTNYQQVEYIQSNGSQWIDTGLKISNDINSIEVILEWQKMNTTASTPLGNYYSNSRVGGLYGGANTSITIGGGDYLSQPSPTSTFQKWNYNINRTAKTVALSIDNVSKGEKTYSGTDYNDKPVLVFAGHIGGSVGEGTAMRLKSYKHYLNGILVRDFVPCYKKTDITAIGLYDLVNEKFYPNQGTGAFTKGADINE